MGTVGLCRNDGVRIVGPIVRNTHSRISFNTNLDVSSVFRRVLCVCLESMATGVYAGCKFSRSATVHGFLFSRACRVLTSVRLRV